MLPFTSDSTTHFKTKVFTLNGHGKLLLFKEGEHLFYRTGLLVIVKPLQIPSLFPLNDVFTYPIKISIKLPIFKINSFDSYLLIFIMDLDLSNCPKKDYDPFLKSSLKFHKQKFELLKKNISLKDFECKVLSNKQLLDFSFGKVSKSLKKYSYKLEFQKEVDLFRNVIFSNNKIKKLDYKRDSIIPEAKIILGKTISNKEIGVDSHVLFLTGQKEFRRSIISIFVNYFTQKEQFNIVILDFGLQPTFNKTISRQFQFNDIFFDPFSFKDSFVPSQRALFISHLTFIGKFILRLNDRQIALLEEKLTFYLQQEEKYSWNSFLSFVQDEISEEIVSSTQNVGSLMTDASTSDFISSLKSVDAPIKSNDFESLLNKLRYLDYLFAKADKTSLQDIFFKSHLDILSLSTTPDLKSLSFYLFNLFYSLNETIYKDFIFMFLDIDSILFDKFNDFDATWIHPDLKESLFDSSDIFPAKKLFNMLNTRVYSSYISNVPVTLVSKETKNCIDKLQFLHNYFILESPSLQRPEFFKLLPPKEQQSFNLPPIESFMVIPKLIFNPPKEYSYRQLYALFDIDYKLLSKLVKAKYLSKHKRFYIVGESSLQLKQIIIDFLSYQPSLSIEENDMLIKFSDPGTFNVFFKKDFSYSGNIEALCIRLLANQFINHQLNPFLLYQFLSFKKQVIDEKQLLFFLIVSIQMPIQTPSHESNKILESTGSSMNAINSDSLNGLSAESSSSNSPKIEIMHDYFSNSKSVLNEPEMQNPINLTSVEENPRKEQQYPSNVQSIIDIINKRINDVLPDKHIIFPVQPIFLIMKFLDSDTIDLINADIQNLLNITNLK